MRGETYNQLMTLGSLVSCRRPTLGDQASIHFIEGREIVNSIFTFVHK